jgi:hypothetical protein
VDPNGLAEQTGREEEKPSEAHELIMGDHNQALQPDPQLQTTPSTVNHHTKSHRSHKKPERRWPAHLIWIASTVLWFIGFRILYFPESDIAVVGALALSAFVLRGPRVRYGLIVWVCGAGIFTLQLVKIAGSAYGVISNYSAPVYLLEATLAGALPLTSRTSVAR